jgi:hypothetical protein
VGLNEPSKTASLVRFDGSRIIKFQISMNFPPNAMFGFVADRRDGREPRMLGRSTRSIARVVAGHAVSFEHRTAPGKITTTMMSAPMTTTTTQVAMMQKIFGRRNVSSRGGKMARAARATSRSDDAKEMKGDGSAAAKVRMRGSDDRSSNRLARDLF